MTQNVNPQPSTQPHPNLSAPPGTKRFTEGSCDDGAGGCFVAYGVATGPLNPAPSNGTARPSGVRVVYVPRDVAAVDLAWTPPDRNRAAPRLATPDEVETYHAEHGGRP